MKTKMFIAVVFCVLMVTGFANAEWELLLDNVPGGNVRNPVLFQVNSTSLLIDYVIVTEPNIVDPNISTVLFEDQFDGAAGTAPDPTKWAFDNTGGGTAVLNGSGQLVLGPGATWVSSLKTASGATTWTNGDEPTVEMGIIFPAGDGFPDQIFFGFGVEPCYGGFHGFFTESDDNLLVQYNAYIQPATGVDTVRWLIMDGTTPQQFRVVRNGDGTADYWGNGLSSTPPIPPCTPPVGDLNGDCIVDMADFAEFSQHWLEDTNI